jgi:multidrug efflux pump subunit AcrB
MPWDKIENDQMGATLRLYGRFRDVEDLGALPVARMSAGRVVRLNEIAKVRRDLEREKARVALSWAGSEFKRSIDISVMKVPGVDTIRTIDRIKAVLEEEARSPRLPHGIGYAFATGRLRKLLSSSSIAKGARRAS